MHTRLLLRKCKIKFSESMGKRTITTSTRYGKDINSMTLQEFTKAYKSKKLHAALSVFEEKKTYLEIWDRYKLYENEQMAKEDIVEASKALLEDKSELNFLQGDINNTESGLYKSFVLKVTENIDILNTAINEQEAILANCNEEKDLREVAEDLKTDKATLRAFSEKGVQVLIDDLPRQIEWLVVQIELNQETIDSSNWAIEECIDIRETICRRLFGPLPEVEQQTEDRIK